MKRRVLAGVVALATAWMLAAGAASAAPPPFAGVQGDYIVVLAGSVDDPAGVAAVQARQFKTNVGHVYRHALKGYSARMPESAAAALRRTPGVVSVERDQIAYITGASGATAAAGSPSAAAQTTPTGVKRIFADQNPDLVIDGVDDQRVDVDIAILDTGSDSTHPDLNVVRRVDCANKTSCVDNSGVDDNGHGTHVAGIAAAIDNGVGVAGAAPGARVWSVKVMGSNGGGSFSGIMAGIDWVTARAGDIEVVNMSLGCDGCTDSATSTAITNAVSKGIVFAVAAGNSAKNASTSFPANHPDVITVSALSDSDGKPGGTGGAPACRTSEGDDRLATFSNFGTTIDVAAPGVCILSTALRAQPPCSPCIWDPSGYALASGTSMAAPHVAGVAGYYTAGANKPTTKSGALAIRQKITDAGNLNWTDQSGDGVKEPLLDVNAPLDPGAPRAILTASCSGNTCSFDASSSSDPDGTITSYAWTFGDGTTGTGKTVSHTYAPDKAYTVKLTVTDNSGKTAATSEQIAVGNPPPVAAFTNSCSSPTTCAFDASDSTDPGGSISSYTWTFGDGTTGTGNTITHRYPNPGGGTYIVKLTVTDNQGKTASISKTITLPANQLPVPVITVSSCYDASHSCFVDGYGTRDPDGGLYTTFTYVWDFGDGTTGTGVIKNHRWPAAGTYTVKLTVTDDEGTSASVTKNVTVP
ncbi:PKD domain-containing protein [Streptomyces sp. NPDC051183]|uniref:PKD domain-containing protein n=1 Tax=Streptomyces sp. NPDC051183 TaxID=3155165 RepID=UPI0034228AFA